MTGKGSGLAYESAAEVYNLKVAAAEFVHRTTLVARRSASFIYLLLHLHVVMEGKR